MRICYKDTTSKVYGLINKKMPTTICSKSYKVVQNNNLLGTIWPFIGVECGIETMEKVSNVI